MEGLGMSYWSRRNFIKRTGAAGVIAGAGSLLTAGAWSRVLGANDEIRVGVIGHRSKGAQHINVFHGLEGVRVVALSDVDGDILNKFAQQFKDRGEPIEAYPDPRKLLDNKDIDVVVIATPNHWHSLMAIWAIQAGKDVYVEKPVSHNVWEGRQLVKFARKYNKIVQAGTQNRSDVGLRAAKEYIQAGNIGKIKWIHGLWYKERESIGRVDGSGKIPESVDYNLWTGPAPLVPLRRINLHYDWHWFWDTGNGDMGNLGVHQIDDCRFVLEPQGLPRQILSFGGRFAFDDDGQTPNTQFAVYDYEEAPIFIETRNLPTQKGIRAMDHLRGVRMGNIIQCEDGYFAGGRGGGWVYDNNNKKIKQFPGDGGGTHQQNFIDAVRKRDSSILHADVEQGHISSALCHLANISYLLGKESEPEKVASAIDDYPQAMETFEKIKEHLAKNEVDLEKTPIRLGAWLEIDSNSETVTGPFGKQAKKYYSRKYRKPFVVPKVV